MSKVFEEMHRLRVYACCICFRPWIYLLYIFQLYIVYSI